MTNATPAVTQKPVNLSRSDAQNAIFLMEVLRVRGIDLKIVLDDPSKCPETFTRSEMYQIGLEVGDKYFINYYNKQKTGRGLRELAASTGKSVAYYEDLMQNPPIVKRLKTVIRKNTKLTCKSVQQGAVFDPKAYTAPDGEIHYRTDWLLSSLLTADVRHGRDAFLKLAEREVTFPDAPVVEDTEIEDQNDEE